MAIINKHKVYYPVWS